MVYLKILKKQDISQNLKDKILEIIENLKKLTIRSVGNLLGDYNNSLDKLVIGSLYTIFFSSPKCIKEKYLIFLRLLSILPISYIILSFIFRSLNNSGVVNLSLFVTPIFVGNKITIFGFFITFILYLKYKEKKRYKMIDEEGNIIPSVFAKISSKIFAFFGLVEFYVGLFHPEFAKYGIGNNYLIILCAPIMILYDYKKDYELHIKPCKNRNLGTCVNISTSIFLYGLIIIIGFYLFIGLFALFVLYILPLCEFIDDNFDFILQILDIIYSYLL